MFVFKLTWWNTARNICTKYMFKMIHFVNKRCVAKYVINVNDTSLILSSRAEDHELAAIRN
jgi:hypothetical protein